MRSEEVLERAEAALKRHGGRSRLQARAFERGARAGWTKLKRLGVLVLAFVFGVPLYAIIVGPLGISGAIIVALLFAALFLAAIFLPAGGEDIAEADLPATALARLPLSTEAWLASQRVMLPPPAQRLADGIGVRLEQLAPQLRTLNEQDPAAFEIRRLIADELPELVRGYERVPAHLRRDGANGISPDKQLIDGLNVVDEELARMSEQLAAGELKQLATQGRFLELKYRDDPDS